MLEIVCLGFHLNAKLLIRKVLTERKGLPVVYIFRVMILKFISCEAES